MPKSLLALDAVLWYVYYTGAWIWILMTKRRGATYKNRSILKKKTIKEKKKSREPFWRANVFLMSSISSKKQTKTSQPEVS